MLSRKLRTTIIFAALSILVLGIYLSMVTANMGAVRIYNLSDLVGHEGEYKDKEIEVSGIVKHYYSFYMHEDFWLESEDGLRIPVEVRQSGLSMPPENAKITVRGMLVYHEFEGGFYSIHADYWDFNNPPRTSEQAVPR